MKQALLTVVLLVVFSSCSKYQNVLKQQDIKPKYKMAERLYKEGDYKRANKLYGQIYKNYEGKPRGERSLFYYAKTSYYIEDYILASSILDRFVRTYPGSQKLEEAMFLSAKSTFMESPSYSLDQAQTDEGIRKIQTFINIYPDSQYLKEANEMAKKLTIKKEKKAYEIAKHYLKLGEFNFVNYRAAVASFNNFIKDYPGSIFREGALFYRIVSVFELAKVSIQSKVKERIKLSKEYYHYFVKYFPNSKHRKEADKIFKEINKNLANFENIN